MMGRLTCAALAACLTAACQPQPGPLPATAESPAPPAQAGPAAGAWFAKEMQSGPAALFGPPQSEAVFLIRCDTAAGQVVLSRSGMGRGQMTMTLGAPEGRWSFDAAPSGGPLPEIETVIPADDPALTALADTKGPVTVDIDGEAGTLRMPADPAIGDTVRQCRRA